MSPILLPGLGAVIEAAGRVADSLITTDQERLQAQIEMRKLDLEAMRIEQATDLAQMEVNRAEAQHASLFVAGWRPAIGWIGAAALAYQYLAYPALVWAWSAMQAAGWVAHAMSPPPVLDADALWVILTGMLGIAGLRTAEKVRGVSRETL